MKFNILFLFICFAIVFHTLRAQEVEGIDWSVDTIKFKITKYAISQNYDTTTSTIDTLLNHIEISHPNFRNYIFPLYTGHIVGPAISGLLAEQQIKLPFYPLFYYQNTIFEPYNLFFFNTNIPYSYLYYTGSDKTTDEQILDFLFTMNSPKQLNYGIQYKMLTTRDQRTNTNSVISALRLWTKYSYKPYLIVINGYINSIKINENGGFIDTAKDFDMLTAQYYLGNASNVYKNRGLTIFQNLAITPNIGITNYTCITHYYKVFTENTPDSNFFRLNRITSNYTYDSIALNLMVNNLLAYYKTKYFNAKVGFKNEQEKYYYFRNYLIGIIPIKFYNVALISNAQITYSLINSHFSAEYYIIGRKKKEFSFNLKQNIKLFSDLHLQLNYTNYYKTPHLFLLKYNGNHDYWDNNFKNIYLQQVSLIMNSIDYSFNTSLGFGQYRNYIYFDSLAMPKQDTSLFSYIFLTFEKNLHLGPLVVELHTALQNVDNQKITLPHLMGMGSVYADFYMFKRNLRLNIGSNIYYTDTYKALAYRPSTGIFYYENQRLTGSMPIADMFISGKVKRAQFFMKIKYFDYLMLQHYYFYINHYHLSEFLLLFGVKWWFKN